MTTAEQKARDMLERMGVENAQEFSAGDLVELANLIAASDAAVAAERERNATLHASAAEVLDSWRRTFPEAWSLRDQQVLAALKRA